MPLQSKYEDEEMAAAILELVKVTLALAGERAALASAQAFTASLQDKADRAARIEAAVKDKHARIVNFEKEIVSGNSIVIFLFLLSLNIVTSSILKSKFVNGVMIFDL